MVGLSNVFLILASLTGVTNGGLLELLKPGGNNCKPPLGSALGTIFGRGLLGGIFRGVGNGAAQENMDPRLANALSAFSQEFSGNTGTSPTGTSSGSRSPTMRGGSGGSTHEPESSEEKTKTSSNNAGVAGPTEGESAKAPIQAPDKPATPESGSQAPQYPATGELGTKLTSGAPGLAGTPGGDVARSMGAAAGAAIASSLLGAILNTIKKSRDNRNKKKVAAEQVGAHREKRSLIGELGLKGSKGTGKGSNYAAGKNASSFSYKKTPSGKDRIESEHEIIPTGTASSQTNT